MTAANAEIPGVHLGKLLAWMDTQQVGAGPITNPHLLAGGTQNVLLRFSRGDDTYVLRRPPPSKRKNSDETIRRKARVLGALRGTDVSHPELAAGERLSDPDHPEWGFAGLVCHPVSVPVINGFALGASALARSEEASQTSASVICRTERVQVGEHVGFAGSSSYADATDSR
jgi:hypothetical protein